MSDLSLGGWGDLLITHDWESPKWRLNNLYKIVDADGVAIDFVMNAEQEHFYDRIWYWNVILKARQVGWTTLLALVALDQCLFRADFNAAIIADKEDNSKKIFEKKVKFAYDNLEHSLRDHVKAVRSPTGELWLSNGSTIAVDTSARSGTLQFLHISEFGKICSKRPEVAKEIISGSLPAVKPGNFIFIESTAEGNEGKFYEMTMKAKAMADSQETLTEMDFRLHFYGWHARKANVLRPEDVPNVRVTPEDEAYFNKSEVKSGIVYTPAQKAWYIKARDALGDEMKRENPGWIEEAFEASMEGLIYGNELTLMRKNFQITNVPWEPGIPVNTFWDLGRSKGNAMAVWCHQRVGLQNHLIRYHEAEAEGIVYFANWLKSWGYSMGIHYLPHDASNKLDGENIQTRADLLRQHVAGDVVIGSRIREIDDGIEATRQFLPSCWIDATNCDRGIKALEHYKRQWNTSLNQYMSQPLHNWASNGADALRSGAQGYRKPYANDPTATTRKRRRKENWRA